MQPPVQSCLPTLEDLACGNTTGLQPQTITKAQLDTARPLQQVKGSSTRRAVASRLSYSISASRPAKTLLESLQR